MVLMVVRYPDTHPKKKCAGGGRGQWNLPSWCRLMCPTLHISNGKVTAFFYVVGLGCGQGVDGGLSGGKMGHSLKERWRGSRSKRLQKFKASHLPRFMRPSPVGEMS